MAKTFTPAAYSDEPYTHIELAPVTSNQVKAIGYDPDTQTLAVCFARGAGAIYHYPDVAPETHAAFVAADSIGTFFGMHIKPLPFKKFRAPEDMSVPA